VGSVVAFHIEGHPILTSSSHIRNNICVIFFFAEDGERMQERVCLKQTPAKVVVDGGK